MNSKICAVVVLYNPEESVLENINSYCNNVETLYVVDNSEKQNALLIKKLCSKFSNSIYINNMSNLGIASALNIACDKAIESKTEWILTMDQDSKFINFQNYLSCVQQIINKENNIGIIAPNHTSELLINNDLLKCKYAEKKSVITSGNILNLKYFNNIGRFDDELFIDMVDFDFSNKCVINGLKIFMLEHHYIIHYIGEAFKHKNILTGKLRLKSVHNAQRVYYMTRNRLYLSKKYSRFFPKEYSYLKTFNLLFIHDITKILLYENDKLKKLKAKFTALTHFLTNKMGKHYITPHKKNQLKRNTYSKTVKSEK